MMRTFDSAIEVLAGGDADAGVRHEEASDLGETRRYVLAQRLQLRVLVGRYLEGGRGAVLLYI